MTRYKITVEYDGTNFSGWQIQNGAPSVQEELQKAVKSFSGIDVEVYGCGRTDAGVHACAMPAHFDLPVNVAEKFNDLRIIKKAINFYLQNVPVKVVSIEVVNDNWNARFDCVKRHYVYRICYRDFPVVLDDNRVWYIKRNINVDDMRKASEYLIGKHDFSSFRAANCQASSPIKTMDSIVIDELKDNIINGNFLNIYFSAKSFLYHQVRNMVGTLVDVGLGRFSYEDIDRILKLKNRKYAGVTAPACGLYFLKADYN